MAFYDEIPWEIAAWVMTAVLAWLAGLYFSKSDCNAAFECIARPRLFPGYVAYHALFLVVQSLFAAAAYMVWRDGGGWAGAEIALALYMTSQAIVVISHFITWVFWTYQSVILGGIVMIVAGAAAAISAAWMYMDAFYWAFALALLAAAFFVIMGVLTIWLGVYGNRNRRVPGRPCPEPYANAWALCARPRCADECAEAPLCNPDGTPNYAAMETGGEDAGQGMIAGGGPAAAPGARLAARRAAAARTVETPGSSMSGNATPASEQVEALASIAFDLSAVQGRNYGVPPSKGASKFAR